MSNINVFLRDNLRTVSAKNMSVAPDISEKKINNAVKAFCYSGSVTSIIALLDSTLFGSGKDGLLFTGEQVIWHAAFSDPVTLRYDSIVSARYVEALVGNKNDKLVQSIEVALRDGNNVVLKDLLECNYQELARILQAVVDDFGDYKEERQLIPIDEMGEPAKIAYVKVVVNMAYSNSDVMGDKEFAEILLLMTRLDLSTESRFSLRAYMASPMELTPLDQLIAQLDANCPDGQVKSVHISLVKDLINVYLSTGGTTLDSFMFFRENRHLLQVTDDEVELALMVIRNDHDMLKEDVSDDQIVRAMKELSTKAAAVGVPLAAVYLSGSVIGLSAAGMTSGLAALGMGGVLGLSSMATGIGVAVLIGVGTYAGVRKLTGANELSRFKRRELMLNEVIKQTQSTLSLLIQDINYITVKLNELLLKHDAQDAQIQKLMRLMSQMSGAGTVLTHKSDSAQTSATRLRCARFLDVAKLKMLTREPTKAELHDVILSFYEERVFTEEKDGESHDVTRLAIRKGCSTRELENLAKAFEAIGYFSVGDVLKGTASDMANKAKDKLAGIFS